MKILLIDQHELFRDGLRYVLQQIPEGLNEMFEAGTWKEGLRCVERHPELDLVLLEPKVPGCGGVDSVRDFCKRYPRIPLVVVSGDEDFNSITDMLNCGASGFVGKSSTESMLLSALKLVLAGNIYVPPQVFQHHASNDEYHLTRRQAQVLECLAEGLSNKEISTRFHLAAGTVKAHVASIYQALRVGSRIDAVQIAHQIGLVGLPPGEHGKRRALIQDRMSA